jgi:hypothetical protein
MTYAVIVIEEVSYIFDIGKKTSCPFDIMREVDDAIKF